MRDRIAHSLYIFVYACQDDMHLVWTIFFHADATSSVRTENIAPTSGFYFELREIINRTKTSHKRGRGYLTSSVIKILRAHPSIIKSRVVSQSPLSSIRDVIVSEQEEMKFSCITAEHVSHARLSRAMHERESRIGLWTWMWNDCFRIASDTLEIMAAANSAINCTRGFRRCHRLFTILITNDLIRGHVFVYVVISSAHRRRYQLREEHLPRRRYRTARYGTSLLSPAVFLVIQDVSEAPSFHLKIKCLEVDCSLISMSKHR